MAYMPPPTLSPADYADYLIDSLSRLSLAPQPQHTPSSLLPLVSLFPSPACPSPTYLTIPPTTDTARVVPELRRCKGYLKAECEDLASARARALIHLSRGGACRDAGDREGEREQLHLAYEAYEAATTAFLRHTTALPPTTSARPYLPALVQMLLDLRKVAILADKVLASTAATPATNKPQPHLEATARQLNKVFTACVADRNPDMELSRKWATYRVVAILFRTYFKLKSLPLCRNILRALSAAPLPPLEAFPRADRVTFKYYTGMLHFLGQEYAAAYRDLEYAFYHCHRRATSQQVHILVALLPLRLLLKGSLPTPALLGGDVSTPVQGLTAAPSHDEHYAPLRALYTPFFASLRPHPSLAHFDAALAHPALERALVHRGTYLAVESLRPILLRSVIRRLWVIRGKSTRIPFADVHAALRFADGGGAGATAGGSSSPDLSSSAGGAGAGASRSDADRDGGMEETEWLLGGLIARGYIRGYLSHERAVMVLSAVNAFPRLGEAGVGVGPV